MPSIPLLPNPYEGPPNIDRREIPPDEMSVFLHLSTLLAELGLYERNLLIGVYLFEYSKKAGFEITDFATMEMALWTTGGWQSMAARDGAMTIYHFGCAINGIKLSLEKCPTLSAKTNHRNLTDASHLFRNSFPGHLAIRHVVAHTADFSKTIEKRNSNAVIGPFEKGLLRSVDPNGITWLPGNMNDCTYAVTHKGEVFTYDLNADSVAKLRSVKDLIYGAFNEAVV